MVAVSTKSRTPGKPLDQQDAASVVQAAEKAAHSPEFDLAKSEFRKRRQERRSEVEQKTSLAERLGNGNLRKLPKELKGLGGAVLAEALGIGNVQLGRITTILRQKGNGFLEGLTSLIPETRLLPQWKQFKQETRTKLRDRRLDLRDRLEDRRDALLEFRADRREHVMVTLRALKLGWMLNKTGSMAAKIGGFLSKEPTGLARLAGALGRLAGRGLGKGYEWTRRGIAGHFQERRDYKIKKMRVSFVQAAKQKIAAAELRPDLAKEVTQCLAERAKTLREALNQSPSASAKKLLMDKEKIAIKGFIKDQIEAARKIAKVGDRAEKLAVKTNKKAAQGIRNPADKTELLAKIQGRKQRLDEVLKDPASTMVERLAAYEKYEKQLNAIWQGTINPIIDQQRSLDKSATIGTRQTLDYTQADQAGRERARAERLKAAGIEIPAKPEVVKPDTEEAITEAATASAEVDSDLGDVEIDDVAVDGAGRASPSISVDPEAYEQPLTVPEVAEATSEVEIKDPLTGLTIEEVTRIQQATPSTHYALIKEAREQVLDLLNTEEPFKSVLDAVRFFEEVQTGSINGADHIGVKGQLFPIANIKKAILAYARTGEQRESLSFPGLKEALDKIL
ncbi:MAG: hypothetical protein R3A13_08185 [Bdellovibrionota bacterium]